MAGHLAIKGYEVRLYNRTPERVEPVVARGGVLVDGEVRGFGRLALVSTDIEEVLSGSEVVMVVVPAHAHASVAAKCAPHLRDGQIVVLNPGRTGGALEFRNVLRANGCKADIILAEAQTFIYASRSVGPAQSRIFRIKNTVPVAALPATDTPKVVEVLQRAYPQFVPAESVLRTSMDNIGAVFHPVITLMNAGWIESTMGEFEYYAQGVTPSVAAILEAVDRERMAVAKALGVKAVSALDWLDMAYGALGENLYEAMKNNEAYQGIKAPPTLRHRYLLEDIPTGLVPMASLGKMLGIDTPTHDCLIHLAGRIHQVDFWACGRTVDKLGIAGWSVERIRRYVYGGDDA